MGQAQSIIISCDDAMGRDNTIFGETWIFSVAEQQWRQLQVTSSPPKRFSGVAGYSTATKRFYVALGEGEDRYDSIAPNCDWVEFGAGRSTMIFGRWILQLHLGQSSLRVEAFQKNVTAAYVRISLFGHTSFTCEEMS